jgi:hypothetical protein
MADGDGKPLLRYVGHSCDTALLVTEVIAQLPTNVARFAYACTFSSMGTGLVMHWVVDTPHQISLAKDFTREDRRGRALVAHGIAHAWLRHRGRVDYKGQPDEKDVFDLCRQWGFDTRRVR